MKEKTKLTKLTKFMRILIAGFMLVMIAIPTFAAESTGGVDTSYVPGGATADWADWIVMYPKRIIITQGNLSNNRDEGAVMKFKLLDKLTLADYRGRAYVKVSIPDYDSRFGIGLVRREDLSGFYHQINMVLLDETKNYLWYIGMPLVTLSGYHKPPVIGYEKEAYILPMGILSDVQKMKYRGNYTATIKFKFT